MLNCQSNAFHLQEVRDICVENVNHCFILYFALTEQDVKTLSHAAKFLATCNEILSEECLICDEDISKDAYFPILHLKSYALQAARKIAECGSTLMIAVCEHHLFRSWQQV